MLSIMTVTIKTVSIMTFSTMTLVMKKQGKKALGYTQHFDTQDKVTKRSYVQYIDAKQNDTCKMTLRKMTLIKMTLSKMTLSIIMLS